MAHEPEQASGNGSDREQSRSNLDRIIEWCGHIKNILGAAWMIGLTIGGLIFLTYYRSIGFMPELDLQSSLAFPIVAAITGIFILVLVSATMLLPAWLWSGILQEFLDRSNDEEQSSASSRWRKALCELRQQSRECEFVQRCAVLCFALAMILPIILIHCLPSVGGGWLLLISIAGVSLLFSFLILYKKSKNYAKKSIVSISFFLSLFPSALIFSLPVFMILRFVPRISDTTIEFWSNYISLLLLILLVNIWVITFRLRKYCLPSLSRIMPLLQYFIGFFVGIMLLLIIGPEP